MGYSRSISNYPEIIALFDSTHMISMTDAATINVETLRIYSRRSLEKELTQLTPYESLNSIVPNHQSD